MKKPKIYIVDDSKQQLENYKLALEEKDYNVTEIANKTELFNVLDSGDTPDLITMDLLFDGKYTGDGTYNGLDIIKEIKQDRPNLKFLIVSNISDSVSYVNRAYNLNCCGYVVKGDSDIEDLPRVIQRILNGEPGFIATSQIKNTWNPIPHESDKIKQLKRLAYPHWEIFINMAKGDKNTAYLQNKFHGDFNARTLRIRNILGIKNNYQMVFMAFKLGVKEVIDFHNKNIPTMRESDIIVYD